MQYNLLSQNVVQNIATQTLEKCLFHHQITKRKREFISFFYFCIFVFLFQLIPIHSRSGGRDKANKGKFLRNKEQPSMMYLPIKGYFYRPVFIFLFLVMFFDFCDSWFCFILMCFLTSTIILFLQI